MLLNRPAYRGSIDASVLLIGSLINCHLSPVIYLSAIKSFSASITILIASREKSSCGACRRSLVDE
jgi:hypothetical protein